MRKVIFDTDIGDDIDDAFALAALLNEPQAELLGVTTVYRNTAQRAQLVAAMLQAAERSVPVYAGEGIPCKEGIRPFVWEEAGDLAQGNVCQWTQEYGAFPVAEGAVDFLIQSAKRYKEELILFAVGPLTNLARAIERDRAAMERIGGIYTMGGRFLEYGAEWNILCDPEAADVVYASGIPVYAVGLDVTLRCTLEEDFLQRLSASPKQTNKLLSQWFARWSKHFSFPKSVMHDPLAVASLFAPVCTFERRYVQAELQQERGAMHAEQAERAGYTPVNVATDVDRAAFYRWLAARLEI